MAERVPQAPQSGARSEPQANEVTDGIPLVDLREEIESLEPRLSKAIAVVLRSGRFILGPEVEAFESEVARYLGVEHAVALNSGTDALVIGLRGLGVGPGDEVITTSFSFFASAEAISQIGAVPVFADIEPRSLNLDPASVEARLSERTRAILPVHLFGHPADMRALRDLAEARGVPLLEDAAQAFGAEYAGVRVGSLGDAAAFSFYPTKNLAALGDGGMLATSREDVASAARSLRDHGASGRYVHDRLGYASRLDELQAAVLRVKLPHVDDWNTARRRVAAEYRKHLEALDVIPPAELAPARHVYHQFTVRIPDGRRDETKEKLASEGIASAVYYPVPLHRMPVYDLNLDLPQAERAASEVLSLPIWPTLDPARIQRVTSALAAALA